MKSKIYIIRNTVNDKVYVGQTTKTLKQRIAKHIDDSKREQKIKRPLYSAINKYGADAFFIELIEECNTEEADAREVYWIKKYKSYDIGGYNATIGGKCYEPYDYQEIAELIKKGFTTRQIVETVGCCKQLVYRVAKLNQLKLNSAKHNREVRQVSEDGNIINIFDSIYSAARYLNTELHVDTNIQTIRKNISRCCRESDRTKAYGYGWEYCDGVVAI